MDSIRSRWRGLLVSEEVLHNRSPRLERRYFFFYWNFFHHKCGSYCVCEIRYEPAWLNMTNGEWPRLGLHGTVRFLTMTHAERRGLSVVLLYQVHTVWPSTYSLKTASSWSYALFGSLQVSDLRESYLSSDKY